MSVPPLRERQEDIPDLARGFLEQIAEKERMPLKQIAPDALQVLQAAAWPGNVRELKNLIERLAILVQDDTITANDIPAPYNPELGTHPSGESSLFTVKRLSTALEKFEKEFINRKLDENNRDIAKTAKLIGVDKAYLEKKIKLKS
jgi:two-component system, NtrC family, nitrogen regulation response regulator NtrX